jgi:hypothetical protein
MFSMCRYITKYTTPETVLCSKKKEMPSEINDLPKIQTIKGKTPLLCLSIPYPYTPSGETLLSRLERRMRHHDKYHRILP